MRKSDAYLLRKNGKSLKVQRQINKSVKLKRRKNKIIGANKQIKGQILKKNPALPKFKKNQFI